MDYALGAGIFLIAVAFAVGFGGQLFAPFGGEADSPTADRLADQLAGGFLGDAGEPGVLDPACTADFFAAFTDAEGPGACEFAAGSTPAEVLGSTARVHVSIERRAPGGGVVALDTTGATPRVDPAGDLTLSTPTRPGVGRSVTTARRVVLLDGESLRLIVRVW